MNEKAANDACIMIVEDEPKLAALLADYLHASGFRTSIVGNGLDVIPAIKAAPPDLVLLDLMLPGRDGTEICRELRGFSHVPVIMVTAKVEEIDRLLGLEIGADDYICKPFSPREVVARVQALLRRAAYNHDKPAPASSLVMNEDTHEATFKGQPLDLTPVEFRLLQALYQNPGRVFSREQLMGKAYSDYRIVTDRTVDTHIKNLRRKLDQVSPDYELIRSIYGLGYKFEQQP
ncbi:two-component system response regulator BaeR [Paucimonas lemoignei]|uniref:Two-component system response regulator BaeR n=1 Tax=Paucimonas lemoignei TaxID=29443 RepID=A0A4R3HT25_PAULE|nr:response regulator [Paucimonas lemoignei]TCS36297.1 two-component system response regulator BaeR [Paucimonas lemoignei]